MREYLEKHLVRGANAAADAVKALVRAVDAFMCRWLMSERMRKDEMWRACYHGDAVKVRMLIGLGVPVETRMEKAGVSPPLPLAAQKGYWEVVRALVEGGADVDAMDECRRNAIHYATSAEKVEEVGFLTGRGARLDISDMCGYYPLHIAVHRQNEKVVDALVRQGAPLNASGSDGETALHEAIDMDFPAAVRILVDAGASLGGADDFGRTPLDMARKHPHLHAFLLREKETGERGAFAGTLAAFRVRQRRLAALRPRGPSL